MVTPNIVVDYLLAPLEFGFMQRGLLASVLVAAICGILGSFVVLKRLAFIGDALAHASFGGVALVFVLGLTSILAPSFSPWPRLWGLGP